MASLETQQVDEIIVSNRRKMLALGGAALASLAFAGVKAADAQTTTPAYSDNDILNFALNLEYLEAQYYTLATAGVTIDTMGIGIGAGTATTGGGTVVTKTGGPASCLVPWTVPAIQSYATETANEERNHVTILRTVLGSLAVAQPNLDLYNSFNVLASKALNLTSFDPFANDLFFLVGSFIFEDVGVTAYSGGAPLLTVAANLKAAAGILAVEAYHAGTVRTAIFAAGNTPQLISQGIANFRNLLDGTGTSPVDDIGVGFQTTSTEPTGTTLAASTVVDAQTGAPNYSKTYVRTPAEVLRIVTGTTTTPPTGTKYAGVFFPNGLNGYFS